MDRTTGKLTPYDTKRRANRTCSHASPRRVHAPPVMHHMAETYLTDEYAPETVADRWASAPERIRTLPPKWLASPLTKRSSWIRLDRLPGRNPYTMIGRPVSFHAMRGISAHSNGFQTCRALHVLQILLGTRRSARRFPVQTALSQTVNGIHPKPHAGRHARQTAGRAAPWVHLHGPDDLALNEDGSPNVSTRRSAGKTR